MTTLADPRAAVLLSLKVGLWCVVFGTPLAVALGWVLARARFRGRELLSTVVLAPLVLPPVVTGLLLLQLFSRNAPLGAWLESLGFGIPFSFAGVVVAALVVGLPLNVSAVRAAFEAIDPRYEELSRSLGRGRVQTFLRVTLPLAWPGILAGALLAFARALGEFGATAVLAGNIEGKTRTISLAIYTLLDATDADRAVRQLLWISLALTFGALLGGDFLRRRHRARLELPGGLDAP